MVIKITAAAAMSSSVVVCPGLGSLSTGSFLCLGVLHGQQEIRACPFKDRLNFLCLSLGIWV